MPTVGPVPGRRGSRRRVSRERIAADAGRGRHRVLATQQDQDARSDGKRGQYKTHVDEGYRDERRRARDDEPDAQQKQAQVFGPDPFHWFTPSRWRDAQLLRLSLSVYHRLAGTSRVDL